MRSIVSALAILGTLILLDPAPGEITIRGDEELAVGQTGRYVIEGIPQVDPEATLADQLDWVDQMTLLVRAPAGETATEIPWELSLSRHADRWQWRIRTEFTPATPGLHWLELDWNYPPPELPALRIMVTGEAPPPPPPPPPDDLARWVRSAAERLVTSPGRRSEAHLLAADCRAIVAEVQRARDPLTVWETELFTPDAILVELGRRWKASLGDRRQGWQPFLEAWAEHLNELEARTIYGAADLLRSTAAGLEAVRDPASTSALGETAEATGHLDKSNEGRSSNCAGGVCPSQPRCRSVAW